MSEFRPSRRAVLSAAGSAYIGSKLPRLMQDRGFVTVGSGDETFECVHDWLRPTDVLFGDTHGVAQDASGRIYVAHTVHPNSPVPDAIAVFSEQGDFECSWGGRFRGGAHGLDIQTIDGKERLFHCDIANRLVVVTDLNGEVLWEGSVPKESDKYKDGQPYVPTNVAFAPDGGFYIGDGYGSHWIHQYTKDFNYVRTFGGHGSEPGQVTQPHGLWVDTRGPEAMLAVADRGNRRIQYFSLDGKHVKFVNEGMRMPCHFSIHDGQMLVPDLESVVTILDENNKVVVALGDGSPTNLRDHPREEFIAGKFIHPHDAMFLKNGDILVAEWIPIGRVTLLRRLKA